MKILHLANHADTIGSGAVNAMVDLACVQADEGHHVAVASSGGHYESLLAAHRVVHIRLVQRKNVFALPAMLARFRTVLARAQPEIVHAHMLTGAVVARLAAMGGDYALIVTVQDEYQKSSRAMGAGDVVVVMNLEDIAPLIRRGIPADRIRVVASGTAGSRRFAAPPAPVVLEHPNVVTVAGLVERKGAFELMPAFALTLATHPDAHLYLIGDGSDRARLEELAASLRIAGRVHFEGFVPDPRGYFAEADVFALAAAHDAWPVVLNEAREAGCAIVAVRSGGSFAALDGGKAGQLVAPDNPAALAEALVSLLDDAVLRETWRQRARVGIERLSVERMHHEYLDIYRASLAARASQRADPSFESSGR
ncbi:glycosyltransferase [Pararobbsia alpina]|uniref:glycosyltransferase n=1 Tax=Pararobbsia alpina TaxID=621374 RepID=UPI0015838F79|nr:glycosyltransferase [Pararobbsia alpina]